MSIEEYRKKYQACILSLDSGKAPVLPTCSKVLDRMLGGGFISGKLVEIYGHEGSGKSTLVLSTIAMLAKVRKNDFFVVIDTEGAICSVEYIKLLGLKAKNIIIINQSDGEKVFDMVEDFISDSRCCMVVIDSVASLVTKEDMCNDDSIGAHARMVSRRLRGLMSKMNTLSSKACLVFINQLRSKIGNVWKGEMHYTTTGGKSIRYYACLRLEMERDTFICRGENRIGFYGKIKAVKSRYSVPYSCCLVPFVYGHGFSYAIELIDMLIDSGYVKRTGAWLILECDGHRICSKTKFELWESIIADSHIMKIIDSKLDNV